MAVAAALDPGRRIGLPPGAMNVLKLAWVGTRTDRAEETAAFFGDTLGLRREPDVQEFWLFTLPDGSKVEVFGADSRFNPHFTTGPVAGFLVDDVNATTEELRAAGVEILHGPTVDEESGNAWVHVRAPDGNVYEFTHDPGVSRPS